jgi:hypothetical protein
MPSNKELVYYAHKLVTDKGFDEERLERVLMGSNEFQILEKNQRNIVNGELPGQITDAQLTMDVVNKYKSIFDIEPSKNTADFLKKQYTNYQLDEKKFDRLLILLKQLEIGDYNEVSHESATCALNGGTPQKVIQESIDISVDGSSNSDTELKLIVAKLAETLQKVETQNKTLGQQDIHTNKLPNEEMTRGDAAPQPSESAYNNITPRYYEDELYNRLTQVQGAKPMTYKRCNYYNETHPDRDAFTEYRQQRNEDEMNAMCKRGDPIDPIKKKQSDFAPLVYSTEPEGTTPLADAHNMMVGSILPPFIYKEYPMNT